jgi:flagellar biosynthetic protein FlhB
MAEEKSEAPSERKLQKAREEGRAPVSREMSMLAGLSAGLVALSMQASPAGVARWLDAGMRQTEFSGAQTFAWAVRAILLAMLAPALAASAGYAAVTLLQTGFLTHASALKPDFSRVSPLSGIKRLASPQTMVQMGKSIAKLAVLGVCLMVAIRRVLPILPESPFQTPEALLGHVAQQCRGLVLLLLGAQPAIAGADFAWERRKHMRELRMSFQELKDEHKENEGNPHAKQRLRQLARSRARRRMMLSVPKSSVIITNPTHYAVALAYERGAQGAPRVVAKGADDVAARIRELAREHRIPIVANPPLARALFRVEIDTEVPSEHFKAVAEVIAFVWRLGRRAGRL